jgi:hypothetical protein
MKEWWNNVKEQLERTLRKVDEVLSAPTGAAPQPVPVPIPVSSPRAQKR